MGAAGASVHRWKCVPDEGELSARLPVTVPANGEAPVELLYRPLAATAAEVTAAPPRDGADR
jgi:hypothetical protein